MKKILHKNEEFYGSTTLGDKGQVVIPVEARNKLKLKKGEKLLVFGAAHEMLVVSKLTNFQKMASQVTKQLASISRLVNKKK